MLTSRRGLMKRLFLDGQYTIERRSEWLIEISIEGPFGERASEGLLQWLEMFADLYKQLQYIILEVSNIGPVKAAFLDNLLEYIYSGKIGGLAIVNNNLPENNLNPFDTNNGQQPRIGLFKNMLDALQFQENLYTTLTQPADQLLPPAP